MSQTTVDAAAGVVAVADTVEEDEEGEDTAVAEVVTAVAVVVMDVAEDAVGTTHIRIIDWKKRREKERHKKISGLL